MKTLFLLVPLALAACAAPPPQRQASGASTPAGAVSCIDVNRVVGRRPEAPRSVVFEMAGGVTYRNEVQGSCPSLERAHGTETLQFEQFAGRLCRDDSVRIYDPVEAKAVGPQSFPRCRLGSFVPVARR